MNDTPAFRALWAGLAAFGLTSVSMAAPAPASPVIPLCPGLTIVTAISQQEGDYESIKTIQSVGDTEVRMKYSAEMKNTDMLASGPDLRKVIMQRTMLTKDLDTASNYQQIYLENSADKIPGTTAIGTSATVLRALKAQGQSEFGMSLAYDGLNLSADRDKSPNYYSYLENGTIKRVDGPGTLSVLVNDLPADLPVIRAQGTLVADKVEFMFLDDVKNPLTLAFRIGIGAIEPLNPQWLQLCAAMAKNGGAPGALPGGGRCDKPNGGDRDTLRVVKISFRCPIATPVNAPAGGSTLEHELATDQKADVYSIYFSFNSDAIRDESEPTLKEIADILQRHPDWGLAVNGHTDGIGGDQYNLDLSKRRAAAVVAALTTRYGIDAKRLKYAGFGKSQPKDTNDTLEGRAKNRRVELMRF
jgi:outer membrane protein OmpA-like peptidoglycan-associated protein